MSKRRRNFELKDYLDDILEMIADIGGFTESLTFEEFKRDKKTIYAVIRCLEVIGEASRNIPSNVKKHYDQISHGTMLRQCEISSSMNISAPI